MVISESKEGTDSVQLPTSNAAPEKANRLLFESRAKASLFGTEEEDEDRIDEDDECDSDGGYNEPRQTTALVQIGSPGSASPCTPSLNANNIQLQRRKLPEIDEERRLADSFVSVLMASSSTSTGSSDTRQPVLVAEDSWEQVETTAVESQQPSSAFAPFVAWLCGTSPAYLPQCPVEKPVKRKYTGAMPSLTSPAEQIRTLESSVLPYVVGAVNDTFLCDSQTAKQRGLNTWNGHLPLDPVPHMHYTYRTLRHKRKHRVPAIEGMLGLDWIGSSSTSSDSADHFALNQYADSLDEEQPHRQEEAAAPPPPPAAKDAAARGVRRPPAAANSMSIPASQQGKIGKSTPAPKERHPETVQVQQAGADRAALKELPALRDAPPAKREELFILKLKLCSVIFSFDDPTADKRGKDMKRQTLLELVDYVNTPAGQKIFTESVMGDLMAMVSANVCRALPPATDDFDPEEDEPVLEPAWPHLQVAYEFFLRFIVSSEVNAKAAKKYVDQKFCLQLVELFDSEDPRERDYLKTILHRIYGKFMSHRSFIRRAISNVFYRFVYETERHNGIGELLEILGSIINGFAIPLKKEHLQFLVRALIPLHKPKCVALYHQQLSYCIIQYVEKDADTATPILNGFFKCWPWSCSGKQVMFLNELEEILELLGADQLAQVSTMLFTNLARCLDSDHFQVVERALFLWNNEHLVNSGCLSRLNAQAVLPIIYGPLYKNSSGHWNATVEGLAQNVLKMYMEYDLVLYDKCTANYFREEEEAKRKLQAIEDRWTAIENIASSAQPAISVK